jgi:bla regulator protein blaR1
MGFSNEIIRSLGMTLVHSLWQGAFIAVVMLFILGLAGKSNARLRYAVLFSGLIMLLVGFVTTFILVYQYNCHLLTWKETSNAPLVFPDYFQHASWPLTPARLTEWLFNSLEPVYPVMAFGWLAGFLFIGIKIAGGAVVSRVNLRKNLQIPDDSMQLMFDQLQDWLKLRAFAKLRITTRMISPMVIGFLKPVVIIPAAAISGLSAEQVEAIMFHELAHIRRFDHILVILQAIAEQVLFFHPVAWFLLREINHERENCCDDFVVKTNNNPINYIKALTMIQEMNLHSAVPANALTGKSNNLLNRVRRLVKPELKHSPAFRLAVIFLFFATVGVSAMTLIFAGKPGKFSGSMDNSNGMVIIDSLQQDSNGGLILNATLNAVAGEKKDGEKKKMKILFVNDTIKEMTINGKSVKKEEMQEYEAEIRKVQQELESSQRELEKTNQELEMTQKELQMSRQELERIQDGRPARPDVSEFSRQIRGAMSQSYIDAGQFKNFWQNEEFKEQMKIAQEEARKAYDEARKAQEEMRIKRDEYWQLNQDEFKEQLKKAQEEMRVNREEYLKSHQKEFQEQMKKAQEEAKKAFEEMKKNKELYDLPEFPYLYKFHPVPEIGEPILPETEILIPALPEVEVLIPSEPETPLEMVPEEKAEKDSQDSESLNTKLKELEEGEQ